MERRATPDEAKFSTQRLVTYALLLIFTAVVADIMCRGNQAERSTIIQTVINFMTFVVGFWIGTSKSAADKDASATRILEAAAPSPGSPIAATDVSVQAAGDVTVAKTQVPTNAAEARTILIGRGMTEEDAAKLSDAEAIRQALLPESKTL